MKNWISHPVQQVYINPSQPQLAVVYRGVHWPKAAAWALSRGVLTLWFAASLLLLVAGFSLKDVVAPWALVKFFLPFRAFVIIKE
ncbi:hypothetical protein [Deinococcus hopiensis]|uniref:hypothetical protein n=1 Tax=Deinococcus hopiensis TaxID=309885 RepID=UPI000A057320|nr:hypothetical protein [Deinococcus hopiensis]